MNVAGTSTHATLRAGTAEPTGDWVCAAQYAAEHDPDCVPDPRRAWSGYAAAGVTDRVAFEAYVEHVLCPALRPGQIVILTRTGTRASAHVGNFSVCEITLWLAAPHLRTETRCNNYFAPNACNCSSAWFLNLGSSLNARTFLKSLMAFARSPIWA